MTISRLARILFRTAFVAAFIAMLALPLYAELSAKASAERSRRLRLAIRYMDAAMKYLEANQQLTPEIAAAFAEAREGLKELSDDVAVIEKQQASFGRLVGDIFPWAAPFLAAGAAYAGGRKHGGHIERKKQQRGSASGGGADPFRKPVAQVAAVVNLPAAHPIPVEDDPSMSRMNKVGAGVSASGHIEMDTASFDQHVVKEKKS